MYLGCLATSPCLSLPPCGLHWYYIYSDAENGYPQNTLWSQSMAQRGKTHKTSNHVWWVFWSHKLTNSEVWRNSNIIYSQFSPNCIILKFKFKPFFHLFILCAHAETTGGALFSLCHLRPGEWIQTADLAASICTHWVVMPAQCWVTFGFIQLMSLLALSK